MLNVSHFSGVAGFEAAAEPAHALCAGPWVWSAALVLPKSIVADGVRSIDRLFQIPIVDRQRCAGVCPQTPAKRTAALGRFVATHPGLLG